jgi:hypothetical protein
MISRSQMNRQLYQMGGEGMQEGMQEGIMQMAPQEMQPQMQQMDAEQYRPVAEQLAQDPNQALMAIVRMLMEQGIPEEEAIKIAKQMIQAVAEGGIEEVSDDTRVEARFGGRIGYAEGGIGRLVNREQYGFGSIFKGVKKVVKGAAKAVKSVAKSKIGRIALTIAAAYALGPAGLNIGAGMSPFAAGALKAGIANLGVQAVSGQGFNFKEALLAAGLGGVTAGLTTPGADATKFAPDPFQEAALGNPTVSASVPTSDFSDYLNADPFQAAAAPAADSYANIAGGAADMAAETAYMPSFENTPSVFDTSAQASTTFPQGDMVTTPTGFNSGYSQFGSGDPAQFGFGKDAIDISNTPPVYKQTSFGKTIGEVETPLSQRYETFKSALGKENYLDALKQVSGVALDYPLTTIGGISTLASAMAPEIPEQLPGESMEEYRARVAEFERQYASNLSGRTGPSLPASARNPFYPVYAANGGRIGYQEGSGPLRPMVMSDRRVNLAPMPGIAPRENIFLNRKSMSEPNLIKQVTQQSFFNTNEDEKNTRYRLPASARNPFYEAMMDEQYTRSRLPTSARNPFYGISEEEGTSGRIGIPLPFDRSGPTKSLMANGGRMGYAMGNSVQEGIMAAPQIANQMGMPVGTPRMNEGGIPELDYRDEGGFVPPIGIKERADDIPAMLSNNEFVFTADAVKNAGGGDPNVGAQKMYTLMKRLESGGRV